MASAVNQDLIRVGIVSASRRIEFDLPTTAALIEVMPNILRMAGLDDVVAASAGETWVLQRLGEAPLDLRAPVVTLGIRSGALLHLRAPGEAITAATFTHTLPRPSLGIATWLPRHTRQTGLVLMLALLIAMPLFITQATRNLPGPKFGLAIILTLFYSVLSLNAAIMLAWTGKGIQTISYLVWASVGLAGIAGWNAAFLINNDPLRSLPLHILLASTLALIAASAGALTAKVNALGLLAAALTAGILMVAAGTMTLNPGHDVDVATVTMSLVALGASTTRLAPSISYMMAGIAQSGLLPVPDALGTHASPDLEDVVERALLGKRLLSVLLSTAAVTAVISSLIASRQLSAWVIALLLCVGLSFALHARAFVSLAHRMALLGAGSTIAVIALLMLARMAIVSPLGVAIVLVSALVLSFALGQYSTSSFEQGLSANWGRWGDALEWLAVAGIIPSVLGVLDLYPTLGMVFN